MSLDNTHHLEGVLLKSGVFRVYLYDVFTKPLPTAEVQGASANVRLGESESSPQIPLVVGKDGHTLEASLGKDLSLPVTINLYLRFRDTPPYQRPEVFTFPFRQYINPNNRPGPPAAAETGFLIFYIYFCIFLGGGVGIWIVRNRMAAQVGAHIHEEQKKRAEIPPKEKWKFAELFQLWRDHRQFFPISLLRYVYMTLWVLTISWLFFGLSLSVAHEPSVIRSAVANNGIQPALLSGGSVARDGISRQNSHDQRGQQCGKIKRPAISFRSGNR